MGGIPSPSARRAWIEIHKLALHFTMLDVALRKEGVDRNSLNDVLRAANQVALRKEGVDRNSVSWMVLLSKPASPSARRAWIEISLWLPGFFA